MRLEQGFAARCGAEIARSARRGKSYVLPAVRKVPRSWQTPAILPWAWLVSLLFPAQISESSDVCNVQRNTKLILRADLTERKAPVLNRDSAAGSVIAYFDELVLPDVLLDVIPETGLRGPTA